MVTKSDQAWNNFVLRGKHDLHPRGSQKWAAVLAKDFMGSANNGGLNAFLTYSPQIAADDVVEALTIIGAQLAAQQLSEVLHGIGEPLLPMSENVRWAMMHRLWKDDLNELDILSDEADAGLMTALKRHVTVEQEFYLLHSPARGVPDLEPATWLENFQKKLKSFLPRWRDKSGT